MKFYRLAIVINISSTLHKTGNLNEKQNIKLLKFVDAQKYVQYSHDQTLHVVRSKWKATLDPVLYFCMGKLCMWCSKFQKAL